MTSSASRPFPTGKSIWQGAHRPAGQLEASTPVHDRDARVAGARRRQRLPLWLAVAMGTVADSVGLPSFIRLGAKEGHVYEELARHRPVARSHLGALAEVAWVYNARGERIGYVTPAGAVFSVAGERVGTDGRVFTSEGTIGGWAYPSGYVADHTGLVLTQLPSHGRVSSYRRRYVGCVPRAAPVQVRAGAVLLLLPVDR
jgi:hypothetical protein